MIFHILILLDYMWSLKHLVWLLWEWSEDVLMGRIVWQRLAGPQFVIFVHTSVAAAAAVRSD